MISSESCPVCQVAGLICWDPGSPRRAGRSRMLPRGVGETGREWSCRPPALSLAGLWTHPQFWDTRQEERRARQNAVKVRFRSNGIVTTNAWEHTLRENKDGGGEMALR